MARHYSNKDFFRQMPNALLASYFQARGLFKVQIIEKPACLKISG